MLVINQESRTALHSAWVRACHYAYDTPRIFSDAVAHRLLTAQDTAVLEAQSLERLRRLAPTLAAAACLDRQAMIRYSMRIAAGPSEMISRAQYAEEKLEAAVGHGVKQYVLVGAGMETFAFRRPDLNHDLQVFEIDRPAVQAFKHQRLAEVGLVPPMNVHFVPVDFAHENVDTALARTTYNPRLPTFFGWLGVTPYIDRDTFVNTLQAIQRIAMVGSHLVFDYLHPNTFNPAIASPAVQETLKGVRRIGEPMRLGLMPEALGTALACLGFGLQEHLDPAAIEARYFQSRSDGYHAHESAYFAWTVVEERCASGTNLTCQSLDACFKDALMR